MPNNYLSLSPSDFETLAADILSAVHNVHFERYGEGRDGGVDCKYVTSDGEVWIGQAKRYQDVKALLRQMPQEQQKMLRQPQAPAKYFLVTACSLSPANKAAIQQAMAPFILSTGDIYGAEDLDALLQQYPNVYRKHHRLWLHGVEQLTHYLQQANNNRLASAHQQIIEDAKTYVRPLAEELISQQLATHHSCLIIGDPGIGKSITAGQVALQLQLATPQAELIWLNDRNFEQALQLVRPEAQQILVLDDFLGATFLNTDGMLAFAQDWQALLFKAQQANGNLKLLFTTRSYILKQAQAQLDNNSRLISQLCQQAICLEHNNAQFRADLVFNLISAAGFNQEQMASLIQEKLYWPLIESKNFTPRLIATYLQHLTTLPAAKLKSALQQGITGQQELWQKIVNRLSDEAQTLLYLIALAGNYANINELKQAFNSFYPQLNGRIAAINCFDKALIELEPTFIKTEQHLNEIWSNPVNPSLIDFLHQNMVGNAPLIDALINSLEHPNWGLDNFAIAPNSNKPIKLKPKQLDQLISKLVTLLPEENSNLMQTYNSQTLEWVNRPDTFGTKLSNLWRVVMGNNQQAQALIGKLKKHLPEPKNWPKLYLEGSMIELLDIIRYLPTQQQPQLWLLAMNNLNNSEDAAALAELYKNNTTAQQVFKPKRKAFKKKLLNACADEIDRTEDPDHLQAILSDLYRIEDATGVNIRDEINDIYYKIEQPYLDDDFEYPETTSTYYQQPEAKDNQEKLARQISAIKHQVEEMFSGLGG